MHDPDILPHMYDIEEMSKTFETAVAPAELDCAPTGKCICSRPECRKCFPPRPDEFGPPIVNSEAWIVDKQVSEKGCEFGEVASSQGLQRVTLPRVLGFNQSSCARTQTSGSLSAR